MPDENKKINLNWSAVEKALGEGTFSGYKIGVLETEKLFANFLNDKSIPGRDTQAKIKYAANFLSQSEKLKYAREIYKKIVEQPHFEISHDETKQVVAAYWQAMLDLEEAITTLTIKEKVALRLKYLAGQISKKIKIVTAIFILSVCLILFFYDVPLGARIALKFGLAAHFLVFKIGPWILGATTALFLLWLGMKMLKKKREF
jgi:hypothetical protein